MAKAVGSPDHVDPAAARAGAVPDGAADERATSEVVASLVANVQGLVRTELELARLELKAAVQAKAVAAGLLAVAALLGLFVLAFLGVSSAHLLALVLPTWAAWLIVTGAYLLLAGLLVLVAVRLLKRPVVPEATKREALTTLEWAKEQIGR